MNRLMKKIFEAGVRTAVIGLIAAALMPLPERAFAAPKEEGIEVHTTVGYQGLIKQNQWYPVRFTLTNKTGNDLKGELVLSSVSGMSSSTADYVVKTELPVQTTVELTIAVPGDVLAKDSNKIRFYKNRVKDGDTVPILGNDYATSRVTTSYTIGVLSRDPDTLNFMPSLNQRGYDITVIPMEEKQLPDQGLLLQPLDTIVINDIATAGWEQEQIAAVKDWVMQGGTLVLAGGAGYSKTAEAFADIAPVAAGGTSELASSDALAGYAGAALNGNQPFTVSTGTLNEGAQSLLSDGGVQLAASRQAGLGKVIYAAFDPSLEPFAAWSGSAALWSGLLQDTLRPVGLGQVFGPENMFWNLQHIVEQFPSVKSPDFMLLLVMFVIYMFVAAPLLYIVLAKTDRREWSWWLIPSLSIVTGIVIFYFGAADKRVISAHTIEIVELTGQGEGVKSGATGLFVPNGGTVKLDFNEERHIVSYPADIQSGELSLDNKTQLYMDGPTSALWRSVPYWSTRKLYMAPKTIGDKAGKLSLSYTENAGKVEINVTNDTASDLTSVALMMNGSVQLIGDLKVGESGKVQMPSAANSQLGYYPYGETLFPHASSTGGNDYVYNRESELVNFYMNKEQSGLVPQPPVIVGFSIDHEPQYKVNGDDVKADNLTMWVQRLGEVKLEGDRIYVPAGIVKPVITENKMTRLDQYGNGVIYVSQGELTFEYALPNSETVNYSELELIFNNSYAMPNNMSWSIWHEKDKQWVDATGAVVAGLGEYAVGGRTIRMKLNTTSDVETSLPLIALKGETDKS